MIELVIYAVGIVLALYVAWCLGANDAANPTNCAVGAGVLPIRKAIVLFVIFAAVGGVLLGSFVMKTVDQGIVPREELSLETLTLGSFSAVLAACLWVTFSTWRGMPVSTTHSIVGGILGFSLVACPHLIRWDRTHAVFASFLTSPFLAILLASGLFFVLRMYFKKVRKTRGYLSLMFLLIFPLCFITLISIFNQILKWDLLHATVGGFLCALVLPTLTIVAFRRKYKEFKSEQILPFLLVLVLCFSALAFGANDMANTTGVFVTPTERLTGIPTFKTMFLLCMLGATGIALGGLMWGHRVITTAAYGVTRLDPLTGVAAEYANAFTVLFFTTVPTLLTGFGMPISTSLSNIGSVVGVGLASKGLGGIHKGTTSKILAFWILTIPCVALISMGFFKLFSQVVAIP